MLIQNLTSLKAKQAFSGLNKNHLIALKDAAIVEGLQDTYEFGKKQALLGRMVNTRPGSEIGQKIYDYSCQTEYPAIDTFVTDCMPALRRSKSR